MSSRKGGKESLAPDRVMAGIKGEDDNGK